ncbi:hypothetical protein LR48_Vigan11g132400 [Vigna angularis]|uniref:Uncharacterized protein n=1 Tax=Phaseolus angularis TaxID=3914 RepID=A0A0L9VT86_PHAAN|nr:hypothetical protein LR48_Vigan11g132400 [Vigna angularis]
MAIERVQKSIEKMRVTYRSPATVVDGRPFCHHSRPVENSQTRLALARALIGLKASRSKKSSCVKPAAEEVEHVVALMLLP